MNDKIVLDNFQDLLEVVQLKNFDEATKAKPQFKKAMKVKDAPKKAVKVGSAPKKAVKTGDAPPKKIRKGNKFTSRKIRAHGRTVHFTNAKNSFKRAQKHKSRKKRG